MWKNKKLLLTVISVDIVMVGINSWTGDTFGIVSGIIGATLLGICYVGVYFEEKRQRPHQE